MAQHCAVKDHVLSTDDPSFNSNKRKTPSELRREQLKRANSQDVGPSSQRPKCDAPKLPRFIDTRSSDVCPPKLGEKPKFRLSELKDSRLLNNESRKLAQFCRNQTDASTSKEQIGCVPVPGVSKFKNVAELSCRLQQPQSTPSVDMAEAIKVLGVNKAPDNVLPRHFSSVSRTASAPPDFATQKTRKFSSLPLDLTLKLSARFISSTSFHWCHRFGVQNRFQGLKQFIESGLGVQGAKSQNGIESEFWKGLHSWIYPQLSFPPAVLSALSRAESSFMEQRRRDWEDSFHSLYYAFRNKLCNIFYFCAHQFVVVFLCGRSNESCSAYLSRSTKGLRGLLQKQGVKFSMPLCTMASNNTSMEVLQELTELEKIRPGQTRMVDSLAVIDNTIQSLLAFSGSNNVHRLYDFLLNYRYLVGTMTSADLPILYSPVPFHSASLKVPEICSKQSQVIDAADGNPNNSYSLEVKGPFLAPWVVARLCASIRKLHKENFEVSFITEPISEGLNVAQLHEGAPCHQLEFGEPSNFATETGIRQLKCLDSSYVASV